MKKGILDLEAIRYALALSRKYICISRQKSNNTHEYKSNNVHKQKVQRFPDKFIIEDLVYIARLSQSTWNCKWGKRFCIVKFPSSQSAVLESRLNGKFRHVNIGHICLASHLDILLDNDIPVIHWGSETTLPLNPQAMPDLKWPESQTQSRNDAQTGTPFQLSR